MKTPIFSFAGLIAICLMAVTSLKAQTTWQAVATDGSWGNAANWTAGIPTNTTQAIFDTSNITTTAHNGDRNVLGITFTGGNNFTIDSGGGVIYSWGNGITVNGGNQTFNAAQLRPRVTSSILNNGAGLLDFNQAMLFHLSTDPSAATITFGGSGNIDLLRYERRTSGMNISIVKSGTGTLTIQGAQTTAATAGASGSIDGPMTINGGIVSINAEANLGANPAAFNAGGLTLNGGSLQGTASFSIDDANRGVTLGASGGGFDVTGTNTLTIANPITGSGGLTKTGTGTLVLSATNNYTGATTVNGGILRATLTGAVPTNVTVGNGGTFDGNAINWNAAGRSFTISGTGAAGSVGALTSTTAGETSFGPVTLAGNATIGTNVAKNNYFSTITGGGNTLTIAGTNETNFRPGHSLVTLPLIEVNTTGSGRLRFEGASAPVASTTVRINSGALVDTYGGLTMGGNLALQLNGGRLESNGGGAATTVAWNGPVSVTANSTIQANGSRRIDLFGNVTGTGTIAKEGGDVLNFRGGITSLGGLNVNAGRVRFESDISPTTAFTASVNSGAILDSWTAASTTRTMGANLTLNLNGGTLEANGGGYHRWNGPVTVSANSNVVTNNRIDFFGDVSGTGTITKTGGSELVFRGGVTSLGGLNVNAGRVRYENGGFGTWAGPITVNTGGILSGWGNQNLTAAVDLNGGTLAVENNGTGTFAGTVTAQSNSTIDTAGGNITLNGALTGTANLGKNGDGVLLINGSSTGFTGTLTMTNGTLRAANTNALPVNVAINSGATFDANGVNFGARDITIAGPGETGFVGAYTNTNAGEGWVRNITLSANATIGSSAGKINSNGAINGGGFTLTVAGVSETNLRGGTTFSNLAGITVATTGNGRLRLEGDITPAALQTITVQPNGRLDTWAARTLGANLAVNLNGGIMESQGSGAATTATYLGPVAVSAPSTINTTNGGGGNRHITLAGTLSGTGNIAKTGPADLQLTGDNTTFSGNINVNQGRLLVNNTSGSGTGTGVVTVASGARLGGTGTIGTLAASGDGVVVQSGGTFAPGNSPGVITIFGTLTLQPGANFEAEIRTPGTDLAIVHDTVTLSNANLTGSWGGNDTNLFRGTYSSDTLNWIIQNESASPISGFFANSQPAPGFASLFGGVTPQLASLGGQTFALFYDAQYTAGPFAPANLTGGNDLLLIAVPEPSRAIFAILALGLLCHRRRRA